MSEKSEAGRSRSLTPEAFASFLIWVSPDQEKAAQVYLGLRATMVKYFIRKGCAHAEDLADRVLDRVVSIVHADPTKYSNALALCGGVARRVWLEYLREPESVNLDDVELPSRTEVASDFPEREMNCLDSCLNQLTTQERDLIMRYHQFQGSQKIEARKELAAVHGGLNKLRITAYRIRIRLHDCVNKCTQRAELN